MALKFGNTRGSAKKGNVPQFEYKNDDNKVRLVGDVLARYVYWIKGMNDKNIPFECLSFDREAEAFINKEKDWVKEFFPDLKCGWAYAMNCIDPSDGKVKVINLKKKLFEQILTAAEDLGDPTDPDEGWMVHFKRKKTGPMVYNVEYQLQVLKCKKDPLTDEQKKAIAEAPKIEDWLPRPSSDQQKQLLEEIKNNEDSSNSNMVDNEVEKEFDIE